MDALENQAPKKTGELYESPTDTAAAVERIHGHFRSIRKTMASEKGARKAVSAKAALPKARPER